MSRIPAVLAVLFAVVAVLYAVPDRPAPARYQVTVIDSANKTVGPALFYENRSFFVPVRVRGEHLLLPVGANYNLQPTGSAAAPLRTWRHDSLFYTQANCAGQAYTQITIASSPLMARHVVINAPGNTLYLSAADPVYEIRTLLSQRAAEGTCENYGSPQQGMFSAAVNATVNLDTLNKPPFRLLIPES